MKLTFQEVRSRSHSVSVGSEAESGNTSFLSKLVPKNLNIIVSGILLEDDHVDDPTLIMPEQKPKIFVKDSSESISEDSQEIKFEEGATLNDLFDKTPPKSPKKILNIVEVSGESDSE